MGPDFPIDMVAGTPVVGREKFHHLEFALQQFQFPLAEIGGEVVQSIVVVMVAHRRGVGGVKPEFTAQ